MKVILSLSIFLVAFAIARADYPELNEATKIALDRIKKFTEYDAQFHTMFWLYTRKNREVQDGQLLKTNDIATLKSSNFDASRPVRFLIHGYLNRKTSEFNTIITKAYLNKGDFNVIVVDWGALSKSFPNSDEYKIIAASIKYLAPIVAEFALFLNTMGVPFEKMYLAGHSLGSHISGMAGQLVSPHKFAVIYALDPAGPEFHKIHIDHRLDKTDADYVESIQTDVHDFAGIKIARDMLVYGYAGAIGHASFFPNYGAQQPGCLMIGCSHSRAIHYFAASIDGQEFYGRGCKDFDEVWNKYCTGPERNVIMGGEPAHTGRSGIYYVRTGSSYPYAITQAEPSNYVDVSVGPMKRSADASHATRILICDQDGGYFSSGIEDCQKIKNAYSVKDVNVVLVDWGKAVKADLVKAEVNLADIARVVAENLKKLHQDGVSYDHMYLIGVKKGAEIASRAAEELAPEKINTLFAIDYTMPINKNAFKYVESISTGDPNNGDTNVAIRGLWRPNAVSAFINTITGKGETKAYVVNGPGPSYMGCKGAQSQPFGGEPSNQIQPRAKYLCQTN